MLKKQNKRVLPALVLLLILCSFTGCMPNNFTKEEKKAFLAEAKEVASGYLSDKYSGAVIKEIEPETTVVGRGYELTEFASGKFVWQKQSYKFVVNTETGEVYTSVHLAEIEERLKTAFFSEWGIVDEESAVPSCSIYYLKGDKGVDLDSTCFCNVFPEGESAEELSEKILQDAVSYRLYIWFQYKGEDISVEMMEWESTFPTLSRVVVYHVAEEHALCEEEEYHSDVFSSLSKEILELNFGCDTASYTRYQMFEQNGIRVTYNAYEQKREQDTVTESVINEEDITLTVTDEYIRLDCAKDNYSMYLSTTDKKIAKKYRYVFEWSYYDAAYKKTQKGRWYPFEDGYVFTTYVHSAVPYEIEPYSRKVIYSSPQKRKN